VFLKEIAATKVRRKKKLASLNLNHPEQNRVSREGDLNGY